MKEECDLKSASDVELALLDMFGASYLSPLKRNGHHLFH